MSLNLDDYFRTAYEGRLSLKEAVRRKDLTSQAAHSLVKREEIRSVDRELEAKKEECEKKREEFRQREEDTMKKEEKLKESVMKYDKFLKENDAKRTRALKRAETERAQINQKYFELKMLQIEFDTLLEQKEQLRACINKASIRVHFLDSAVKMSGKYENIGQFVARFQTIQSSGETLIEKQTALDKERERMGLELRQYVNEQRIVILDHSNTLSQKQTQLDRIRAQAYKWEAMMKRIQSTATKETLLQGQIKVTTLNLYHMISRVPVDVEDTFYQLEKIKQFIQARTPTVR